MDFPSLILGALGILVPAGSGVLVLRARRRHESAAEEATQFQNDIEFRKYVDGVVEKAVETATKPLRDEIGSLKDQLKAYLQKDRIVSRFVQRLYWWDDGGRHGDMPRLTFDEQNALDLGLFPEDTQPPRTAD